MSNRHADLSESSSRPRRCDQLRRRGRKALRITILLCGILGIALALFILSPAPSAIYYAMDDQDDLSHADYILCLGGEPGRILEAVRLLNDGYAPVMIVTNNGPAADRMRAEALDWGAPPDRVLADRESRTTRDHPAAVAKAAGIDIENDRCIIVTSYTHMARARRVFEKAGYRHLILREPRWERAARPRDGLNWRQRFLVFPSLAYEGSAWVLYWFNGDL